MLKFNVITLFPESLGSYLGTSLMKRALTRKIVRVNLINLRRFGKGKRKKVDDRPFGGGPGMVLMFEPIAKAVKSLKLKPERRKKNRIILFSLRGKKFNADTARRLSRYDNLILICGRYEGVDERVAKHIADEEISIGDYVLSGGELPALVLMEAVSRYRSGFLGKDESLEEIKGSYPVYTQPEAVIFRNRTIKTPPILLSGNHKKIEEWRKPF